MKITKEDACRILGVAEDSTSDEVRSSYKRLALKWHPDKHGDSHVSKDEATHKFQEVSAAYKRLTTNANDPDDEIDDSEFMNIREMMELFAHIFFHNGVRGCPHHGMDCCDYDDDEYYYSDDEYYDYTDEESEDELLDSIAHRLRSKYEARKYMTKDMKQPSKRQSLTEEEALRNARELIEEEELEKMREEKKKAKRKKKKEKKKQREKEKKEQVEQENGKKEDEIKDNGKPPGPPPPPDDKKCNNKENDNPKKDIPPPPTISNGNHPKENTKSKSKLKSSTTPTTTTTPTTAKTPTTEKMDTNNPPSNSNTNNTKKNKNDTKKNNKNKQNEQTHNNKKNKNKNTDNTNNNNNNSNKNNHNTVDSESEEDTIDTSSAFFARAASKAPTVNGVSHTTTNLQNHTHNGGTGTSGTDSNKKKKNNSSHTTQAQQPSKKSKKQNSNHNIAGSAPSTPSHNSTNRSNHQRGNNNSTVNNSTPTVDRSDKKSNNTSPGATASTHNNIQNINPNTKNNANTSSASVKSDSSGKREDLILQSRQVAVQGNQMAQNGDFQSAVRMFTKAIQLDPTDFRFLGNRSYCYDRIELYDKALEDANAAIQLSRDWPKGYFRKGRALNGLKRFQEAEQVFQQVLKLDPGCEDAHFELARVRVQILMDMGFSQGMSEQAVRNYETVQQALEALLAGKVSDEESLEDVYYSEDEHFESHTNKKSSKGQSGGRTEHQSRCTALWVGNVDPQLVTDKQMLQLFSKCGKVASVRILPHRYCAFVNYVDPSNSVKAMEKLQGAMIGNQKLLLKYPNNPPPGSVVSSTDSQSAEAPHHPQQQPSQQQQQQQSVKSRSISESSTDSNRPTGPVNGNECYFWRTTGCVFESQCRYKHVRGHKGVDLPKVQAKYGKISTS